MSDIGLFSLDDDGTVVFGFRNMDRVVTGPEEALQTVAYAVFTEPGSNAFARNEGGGLLGLVGLNVRTQAEILADAAIAISRAMNTIALNQSDDKPDNATVENLELIDVRVRGTTIEIDVRILLQDGNSFRARFRSS